jgi:hypothetical protein
VFFDILEKERIMEMRGYYGNCSTFAAGHKKKPDSSPVTESWERNARDCGAKV